MTISRFQQFKKLHYSNEPLFLSNVWNVGSALLFREYGFSAVGTSSAAIAAANGFNDGEAMRFDDHLKIAADICSRTDLLVSVDIEGGYGRDAETIAANILRLAGVGVVGINIEDSVVAGDRRLIDAAAFAETLAAVRQILKAQRAEVFINVRTDTYLLNVSNKTNTTAERIRLYEKAGADGIFIPCLTDLSEMREFCSLTALPVNVMCMPDLPDFESVRKAGAKRISMGNFFYERIRRFGDELMDQISKSGTFAPLF